MKKKRKQIIGTVEAEHFPEITGDTTEDRYKREVVWAGGKLLREKLGDLEKSLV